MAFKGCNTGNWHFTVAIVATNTTVAAAVVSALTTFIAFTTITAIAITTAAFAWRTLLFAALLCAWRGSLPGTLSRGLLTG